MAGISYIIFNKNFESKGLGKVTLIQGDVPLESLSIQGADETEKNKLQFKFAYTPINTTEKGVEWSIVSGEEYAEITNDGVMTIKPNADNSNVVVMITSLVNASISNTFNVVVSYVDADKFVITDNLKVSTSGVESTDNEWATTDFIPCEGGNVISNGLSQTYAVLLEYTADKTFVDYWGSNKIITLSSSTKYLRLTFKKKNENIVNSRPKITNTQGDNVINGSGFYLFGNNVAKVRNSLSLHWYNSGSLSSTRCFDGEFNMLGYLSKNGEKDIVLVNGTKYIVTDSVDEGEYLIDGNGERLDYFYNTTIY